MGKKGLFGTSGIRGDAQEFFTNQFCFDIGRSFGKFLKNHKQQGLVAIGMDPRLSSPRIKRFVASGIISEGFEVRDQGIVPIPAINYILIAASEYSGSLMISGSHIKPHLNGIKFFANKEEISKEYEAELEQIYSQIREKTEAIDFSDRIVFEERAKNAYQEMLLSLANTPYPLWKIVVDSGNGATSDTLPQVYKTMGLNVIEINTNVQEEFMSRDTEVEGDFKQLQEKVLEEKADFGVGFDSDGDRVIFVSETGEYIPGDYSGALIARDSDSKAVVTPVNTSSVIDEIGKTVYRTKVGSPYVVAKMKETGSSFGFEANGGGISAEIMFSRDAGGTSIKILNILAKSGKKLSQLVAELPKLYIARDKVDYEWSLKDKILEAAREEFKGIRKDETDGLKIWLEDHTWILFRSSQNAPEFRVFAESRSHSSAYGLLKKGIKLVEDIVNKK